MSYIKSGGTKLSMMLLFVLFISAQIFYSSTDIRLKDWIAIQPAVLLQNIPSNRFHLTREQCLYVYAGLIAICIFFTWNKLVVFYNTYCADVFFHNNPSGHINCLSKDMGQVDTLLPVALVDCLGAPMWFFHHNPSGHINRFSKDMGQVDTLLPVALVDCLWVSRTRRCGSNTTTRRGTSTASPRTWDKWTLYCWSHWSTVSGTWDKWTRYCWSHWSTVSG
ncbi:putative ATP-dependent bile acid permease [Operophtera brumata]|uniref:Putative ATP-dependent bile acid permease n=1 Tax=Operophtera brumata TaxID=104452 RepID=A0A0L7L6J5_OPEBR|nr:putative ATP-dependent bile acid permease [Operophtera brumata]